MSRTDPGRRPPRWGLRTMGFLLLGILAMAIGGVQGYNTFGTVGCSIIGLAGAAWCSYRGVVSLLNLEWHYARRR